MRKRGCFVFSGGAIAAVCLLGNIWSAPARAQNYTSAIPSQKNPASKATNTLDLRDAPIRSSLELLLTFCGASYSIDPRIGSPEIKMAGDLSTAVGKRDLTTVRFTNKPFDEALHLLRQSAPSPITVSIEHDKTTPLIYVFKPEKRAALLQASVHEDTEEMAGRTGEKKNFSYRVCGIVRHDEPTADKKAPTTTWLALLTRDVPENSHYATAKIVRVNAWMAGIRENSPPLRVTGIDEKGVTVLPLGGTAYKIPLASVSEQMKPAAVPNITALNPGPVLQIPETDMEMEETVDTITLRGASARSAMEFIFQVNDVPYVIDDSFSRTARTSIDRYVVRHKPNEDKFQTISELIGRASAVGYHGSSAGGINARWFITPNQANQEKSSLVTLPLPVDPLSLKYVNERQVPRRVRGLLFRDVYYRGNSKPTTIAYVLLETETLGTNVPTATEIVKSGTQVSSPIKDGPSVRVTKIDTEGIWLQAEGDEPFRVPLEPLPKS